MNVASRTKRVWWYSITIDDPELASGASFGRLVARTSRFVPCAAVTMSNLEIVPGLPPEMQEATGAWPTLAIDQLEKVLRSVTQLVWGRFFFFRNLPDAQRASNRGSFYDTVASAELTICILDNTSYVIFCKSLPLVCDALTGDWAVEVIKEELSRILKRADTAQWDVHGRAGDPK